jgi:hypothetical protein
MFHLEMSELISCVEIHTCMHAFICLILCVARSSVVSLQVINMWKYIQSMFVLVAPYSRDPNWMLCLDWESQITSDLYILNWKSSYDNTLLMCQSRSTIFPGISDPRICKNTFLCSALHYNGQSSCDHQISNWCREMFKYNTVISWIKPLILKLHNMSSPIETTD